VLGQKGSELIDPNRMSDLGRISFVKDAEMVLTIPTRDEMPCV